MPGIRRPCDRGGREGSDATASQGHQKHQKPEEVGRTLPWGPQREHDPAHTLTSGFRPPKKLLLFEAAKCVLGVPATPGRQLPILGSTSFCGLRHWWSQSEGQAQEETAGSQSPTLLGPRVLGPLTEPGFSREVGRRAAARVGPSAQTCAVNPRHRLLSASEEIGLPPPQAQHSFPHHLKAISRPSWGLNIPADMPVGVGTGSSVSCLGPPGLIGLPGPCDLQNHP